MQPKVANHFKTVGSKFVCKICNKELNKPKDNGQAGISYHLKSQHSKEWELINNKKGKHDGDEPSEHVAKKVSQPNLHQSFNRFTENSDEAKAIHRAIAQWIAVDCVPLQYVEKPGFMNLVKKLRPQFRLKSRTTYTRTDLIELYQEYEGKLSQELASVDHVSIGIDLWSDEGGKKQVIGIIVFFQSGTKLVHRVLDIVDIADASHTGDLIATRTLASIEKYGLDDKVSSLVRDGASNVKLAGKILDIQHFDCFNHRLHLAASDGMSALGDMKSIVQKLKKIARKLKASHTAQREMTSLQAMLDLPSLTLKKAIDIRWNSIHDMLHRAIQCKQALCLFIADYPDWPQISNAEFDSAHSLCEVLAPLKDVSDIAQARENLASTVIPVLTILIERMDSEKSCATVRAAIKKRLVSILETYKQNDYLVVHVP